MHGWRRRAIVVGILLWSSSSLAWAAKSDMEILLDTLVHKDLLTSEEAESVRQEIVHSKQERASAQPQSTSAVEEALPASSRTWSWKGDIRLRDEVRNRVGTGNDTHRQRIRFRYGFEGAVSDELKVGARLLTGSTSDATSTNQSFDTSFAKKAIVLDLAYVDYRPKIGELAPIALIGGMIESPLWSLGQLVWDSDLSWDGAAAQLHHEVGDATLFMNAGLFSLDTDETEAASLWVVQGGASITPFPEAESEVVKHATLTGSLAYHDYLNVASAAKSGTDPLANIATNTAIADDFNQLNPTIQLASQMAGYPVAFSGDWVRNLSAGEGSGNDGFEVGLKFGKATTPWSFRKGWEVGYLFKRIEENAVFDEFTDSDFGGGGTNRRGHVWWVTLATLKSSTLTAKCSTAHSITGAKANEDRIQLDWLTKF